MINHYAIGVAAKLEDDVTPGLLRIIDGLTRAQLSARPRGLQRDAHRRTILAARLTALWALRLNLLAQELRRDR